MKCFLGSRIKYQFHEREREREGGVLICKRGPSKNGSFQSLIRPFFLHCKSHDADLFDYRDVRAWLDSLFIYIYQCSLGNEGHPFPLQKRQSRTISQNIGQYKPLQMQTIYPLIVPCVMRENHHRFAVFQTSSSDPSWWFDLKRIFPCIH